MQQSAIRTTSCFMFKFLTSTSLCLIVMLLPVYRPNSCSVFYPTTWLTVYFSLRGFSLCLCVACQFVYFLFFVIFTSTYSPCSVTKSWGKKLYFFSFQILPLYESWKCNITITVALELHKKCPYFVHSNKNKKHTRIIFSSDASFHVKEQKNSRKARKKKKTCFNNVVHVIGSLQAAVVHIVCVLATLPAFQRLPPALRAMCAF